MQTFMLQQGANGCEVVDAHTNEIMNELMIKLGTQNNKRDRQEIIKNIQKIAKVRESVKQWKFGILFEKQRQLELEVQINDAEINEINQKINQYKELTTKQISQLKQIIYAQTKQQLYEQEAKELAKNLEHLTSIASKLQATKKSVVDYKSQLSRTQQMKKIFIKEVQDLYKMAQRMIEELTQKSASLKKQNENMQLKNKQLQQKIVTLSNQSEDLSIPLQIRRPNSKLIQKQTLFYVREIQGSKYKLGESEPANVIYRKVSSGYEAKNEIGIYLIGIVFFLLIHYVLY